MAAKTKKAKCPKCGQAFAFELLPEMISVACTHCNAAIEFRRKSKPKPAPAEPKTQTPPLDQEPSVGKTPPPITALSPSTLPTPETTDGDVPHPTFAHKPLKSLLPPTFDLGSQTPEIGSHGRQSQVILPTPDGGLQQIDTKTVTIRHDGKTVTLKTSTPRERTRRRFIENLIAIVLAVGIIALAMWILS